VNRASWVCKTARKAAFKSKKIVTRRRLDFLGDLCVLSAHALVSVHLAKVSVGPGEAVPPHHLPAFLRLRLTLGVRGRNELGMWMVRQGMRISRPVSV
jgi:hypothetical protein